MFTNVKANSEAVLSAVAKPVLAYLFLHEFILPSRPSRRRQYRLLARLIFYEIVGVGHFIFSKLLAERERHSSKYVAKESGWGAHRFNIPQTFKRCRNRAAGCSSLAG